MGSIAQVSVKKADGPTLLNFEDFMALPIKERVDLIIKKKVAFHDEAGAIIPIMEAMKYIKTH